MRIVSLEPYITDCLVALGVADQIVGVTSACDKSVVKGARVVTAPRLGSRPALASRAPLAEVLASELVQLEDIIELRPTHLLTAFELPERLEFDYLRSAAVLSVLENARNTIAGCSGAPVEVHGYAPATLKQVFETIGVMGKDLGLAGKGLDVSQRIKAQIMDWGDNFYERMKGKRVSVLVGIDPMRVGGRWVPDMVGLASGIPQEPVSGAPHRIVSWQDVRNFRPDVILVVPQGMNHDQSLRTFKILEKLPDWEMVPAVKRGEVFFAEGAGLFDRPSPNLLAGMGVLVSAMAGLESGYITKRDSFVRLRFLEVQRHRFS